MAASVAESGWSWDGRTSRLVSLSATDPAPPAPPRDHPASAGAWEFGRFRLLACGTLLSEGRVVALTPKEEAVLRVLVGAEGRRVSKDEILDAAWKGEHVSDASLTRAVHTLRRRLGDGPEGVDYIRTIYGRGYQLAVPARRVA